MDLCSGAVVFTKKSDSLKFLLLKSNATGFWVFPKGHVLESESLLGAAKREVMEETGISNVEIYSNFKETIEFFQSNSELKRVVHYLFKVSETCVILSNEHSEFKWLTFDEAYALIDFENQKNILNLAKKTIQHERN